MKINTLITILGPTASGKTRFAAYLAYHLDGEIISADSRQVYKDMTIGTGKDYGDYKVHGKNLRYHLIDILDPGYRYNVYEYQKDFIKVFNTIISRNKQPVLAGGTGLYIQAILEKYKLIAVPVNEELRDALAGKNQGELVKKLKEYPLNLHNTTDLVHRKRTIRAIEIAEYYAKHAIRDPEYPDLFPLIFGIKYERETQRKMISERLKSRLDEGMIEEVKKLLSYIKPEDLIYYGLEYKFITLYLTNNLSYNEMFHQLEISIHQFAKRQMTWFRRMEKMGYDIHWLEGEMTLNQKLEKAFKILNKKDIQLIKQ